VENKFMREKIKKILTLINRWKIILAIFLIGVGLFYWYEYRPSRVYIECNQKSTEWLKKHIEENPYGDTEEIINIYNFKYKNCLREKGINK